MQGYLSCIAEMEFQMLFTCNMKLSCDLSSPTCSLHEGKDVSPC